MDPDLDILLNFPGIRTVHNQSNKKASHYKGFVFIQDIAVQVEVKSDEKGIFIIDLLKPNHLYDDIIKEVNGQKHQQANQLLHQFNNLASAQPTPYEPYEPVPTKIYRKVIDEYQEFVKFYVFLKDTYLSGNLSLITTTFIDAKFRRHHVAIKADHQASLGSGNLFSFHEYLLPVKLNDINDSLITLFEKYIGAVDAFQEFFNVMDEIDRCCWVVDPEVPNRAHSHRRIVLAENLSVVINIHPNEPMSLPNIKLIGPADKVKKTSEEIARSWDIWDESGDIVDELLKMFNLDDFPKKPSSNLDEEMNQWGTPLCSICYSTKSVNDNLVDFYCPNLPCSQCFHMECLFELVQKNLGECLDKAFGKCPYCKNMISCELPKSNTL